MYIFRYFGMYVATLVYSTILVFRFLGHLFYSFINIISGKSSVAWSNTVDFMYYAGARPVTSLFFICLLVGISVSQAVYFFLQPFHLHQKVLPLVQNILTHEILPIIIGFILCIQMALHLISTRLEHYDKNPEEFILSHVWPIIIGMNLTSLLLYVYLVTSIFLGFYISFHFLFGYTTNEFLFYILNATTAFDLTYSVVKTLILCIIIGFSASYYYYEATIRKTNLRKAISRVLTRSSFWLIISSMYITYSF
jgi:ABC-type transporter Mla maintaining outer membrane lipid asymmetry permease subunit MlaE